MEHELLEKIQVEIEFEFMVLEFQKKILSLHSL